MSNLLSPGWLANLPALIAAGIAATGVLALAAARWTSRGAPYAASGGRAARR
ncbi:hypothetical protein ACFXKS_21970 [Streptomyces scopuliridis]|uniref:hypothetical protein n=1 Tax=Streptomyces scopuliridis TaxID=452529 RepID=UPI0036C8FB37